jgi:hypothetical protein
MRRRFRVVGSENPANVFNDLNGLRQQQAAQPTEYRRRKMLEETFARIPHDRAHALARHNIGAPAWVILIELDRLILKQRGRNPVRLTNHRLKPAGIIGHVKARALRQLEAAEAISVPSRGGGGQSPLILHRWFPQQD